MATVTDLAPLSTPQLMRAPTYREGCEDDRHTLKPSQPSSGENLSETGTHTEENSGDGETAFLILCLKV